ncbi:hypothetical protein FUAX_42590 (plasmid) [Fulvitalea axinellae]|uniref:SnoaL-like domain-containing protein n=1 Tax=Fulvitalea axinellae TaxID=1182444 RepID=A0AAU9D2F3_9BACT|nr:hypothetical protein FUAX_42590 [Fulvitalea axinellae]
MEKTALEVFQSFGQKMMSGNDSWQDLIADDIQFIGPVDQLKGKKAFIELNESFMPTVRENNLKQLVESGNWVITQNEMRVAMKTGKTISLDMTEWIEVVDGKIQLIKVFYDAEEYRKEMNG